VNSARSMRVCCLKGWESSSNEPVDRIVSIGRISSNFGHGPSRRGILQDGPHAVLPDDGVMLLHNHLRHV